MIGETMHGGIAFGTAGPTAPLLSAGCALLLRCTAPINQGEARTRSSQRELTSSNIHTSTAALRPTMDMRQPLAITQTFSKR
jgi:hypothetical protein